MTLASLKNLHCGESCFILGNGPSLDLAESWLPRMQNIIGMNRSFFITNRAGITPEYYCIVRNNNYIEEMAKGSWDWSSSLIFYLGPKNRVFGGIPESVRTSHMELENFIFTPIIDYCGPNLSKGHRVKNTGEWALYVAGHLGFKRAFLLGYDCRGHEGHFNTGAVGGRWGNDKASDHDLMAAGYNKEWGPAHTAAFPDLEVFNLNPNSAIIYWEKIPIDLAMELQANSGVE